MLFRKTLDRQLENRPKAVKFCRKCVVSNQRPRITFDENGVCSACHYAHLKHNVIDWKEREQMLLEVLAKHRSRDGSYDCIVPGSGGKDSAYVAHQLKYVYGMHPLHVTWAPAVYTDIGWQNLISFKDHGFDSFLFFPDGTLYRKLARLGFELVGDGFMPFVYGQKAYPFHMAVRFKVPLIFWGESGELEYGGSTKNVDEPVESLEDWTPFAHKGCGIDELIQHGLEAGLLSQEELKNNPLELYRPPSPEELEAVRPEMHWFSFYKKWVPPENFAYVVKHTGFQANPDGRTEGTYTAYASIDDKTDGFHYYMGYIKFGLGRATSDAAHEIRDGRLTREEGVALVHKYDDEFPKKYFKEFLEYASMTEAEFWEVVDFYRSMSPHLWEKVNGEWVLKHKVA